MPSSLMWCHATIVAVLTFSVSCAGLFPSSGGRVVLERSVPERPDWIVRVPVEEGFVYVTGFATGAKSLPEGRSAASLAAVAEVAAYLGVEVSAYFSDRQTLLATEILSLIETSSAGRVRSGRMAELYYEMYSERRSRGDRNLYDVYVLFRVPTKELEAERAALLLERSSAVRRAEEALERASDEAVARDLVAAIGGLASAYRHLSHLEPSSESMHRIEGRLTELAARISLTLEVSKPAGAGSADRLNLRGHARLVGSLGAQPLRGVPLMFSVETAVRTAEANAVTDEEGRAETSVARARRLPGVARVRLHPAALSSVLASEEPGDVLVALLAPLRSAAAERVIPADGYAASVRPATRAGQGVPRARDPVQILLGRRVASPGVEKVSYPILVRLSAPIGARPSRPPLNVGLVLDTSASMDAPGKIGYVREAAMTLVRYLGPRDTLSIVTYDTEAQVLLPAALFGGRRTLLHVLDALEAGGRTNVSGGIETALAQVVPHAQANATSRLILLTDGRANEGITDADGLVRLATEVRRRGVSLSTIGLGSDFDSGLLLRMAENGGGRYHYAAAAAELPGIVAREVEGLLAQSMGESTIDLELTPGARVQSTFGYPLHADGNRYEIPVGSLSEGNARTLVVELEGRCASASPAPLGTATVRYRDWTQGGRWRQVSESLGLRCSFERDSTQPTSEALVAVYVKLMRALDRLDLALSSGDEDLAIALPAFLAREVPAIRATAAELGDPALLDLLSLFEHGMEEIGEGSHEIHEHEAEEEVDIKRDAAYRLYLLRHHGDGHRLLGPEG